MAVPYASDLKEAPEQSGRSSTLTAAAFENRRVTALSWLRSYFTDNDLPLLRHAAGFSSAKSAPAPGFSGHPTPADTQRP
ncbi:hypothetical protein B0C58_003600 [Salmonella enterica subsp. enterica serovar Oranienburg]|nr:hypothetical protein [Salmonella enterica subsp. enterica serovar Oranienburg]